MKFNNELFRQIAHEMMDKAMLYRHGTTEEIAPTMCFVWNDGTCGLMSMAPVVADDSDYFLFLVRSAIQRMTDIEGVIFWSETWMASQEPGEKLIPASQNPNRKEAIYLIAETRQGGEQFQLIAEIKGTNVCPKVESIRQEGTEVTGRLANWFNKDYDKDLTPDQKGDVIKGTDILLKIIKEARDAGLSKLMPANQ